jgi:hypothetical protein
MKKRLLISFSGGRTSAFMLWWIFNVWEERNEWEKLVVFANTGKEKEGTLFFVDECAQEWGIPIVWVEAMHKDEHGNTFSPKGWQVKSKVVTYETASRKGEPFEEMISVLGIPSTSAAFCSPQLKKKAILHYVEKVVGWEKWSYHVAIGIRADEPDRQKEKDRDQYILQPLAKLFPVDKSWILNWWNQQSFDLDIHPDDGNCDACWKKDLPRHCRIMLRSPQTFDWWEDMTAKYGHLNPRNLKLKPPYNFFRGNLSVQDIRELAPLPQEEIKRRMKQRKISACNESCEAF